MTGVRDVVVVGGGLVGAATALGIARTGRTVTLVDRQRPTVSRGWLGMDIRNIACAPASRGLLESLGAWDPAAAAPYVRMHVWEERGTASLDFAAAEVGRSELGWILENSPTVTALWALLDAEPTVEIVLGELQALTADAEHVAIQVGVRHIQGRLLVGVDGARSVVRSLAGVPVETLATGQQALATVVRTEKPHGGVAHQRFLLDGPLALLPSREPNLVSVVWSQSPPSATRRKELEDEAFAGELEAAIEARLGAVEAVDARLTFPLAQHVVSDFNPADRVLLIGDAARVLHPLAGLGANVGFEDARDLLAVMARIPPGGDPGTTGIWRTFARRRRVRARMMVAAMAGFRQGYAGGGPLESWLRNLAVGWFDRAQPIKRQIIREALGLGPVASTL
ncbi:MAG: FAD-dependent oxidoreductase [Pseudomonadales bacterium]